jgi:hypothetical protein
MGKAGGIVTDYHGKTDELYQHWDRKDGYKASRMPSIIVSGNEKIHKTLVEVLGK